MSRRTVVCREFSRGSCRFGSRCKFSHDTSQQQRQQSSSPFGFGVKNQGQQQPTFNRGGNYYTPLTSQRQEKNQSQSTLKEHRCKDPKECKLQIKEDLENEQPVFWRLTCYAHGKYLPNDVVGDASFEELRVYAYAAGKQGMSFNSVVQNERNMFDAKKKEFDSLLKKPYSGPAASGSGSHAIGTMQPEALKMSFGTATPGFSASPFGASYGSAGPSQASSQSRGLLGSGGVKDSGGFSFGLGASSGTENTIPLSTPLLSQSPPAPGFSFGMRSSDPGSSIQGSPPQSAFGNSSFGMQSSDPGPFIQASPPHSAFENSSPAFSSFGQGSFHFNPSVGQSSGASHNLFGSSSPIQAVNENPMSNSLLSSQNNHPFGATKVLETSMNQMMTEVTGQIMHAGSLSQQHQGQSDDKANIWLKETWSLGEIPEEEPPPHVR